MLCRPKHRASSGSAPNGVQSHDELLSEKVRVLLALEEAGKAVLGIEPGLAHRVRVRRADGLNGGAEDRVRDRRARTLTSYALKMWLGGLT